MSLVTYCIEQKLVSEFEVDFSFMCMYVIIVQNWPEATDPHKFVYEDIAIATYLLVSE